MSKLCKKNHRDLWIIAGGKLLWCYRCGAWRPNTPGRLKWQYPIGEIGDNPALKDGYPASTWVKEDKS